MNNLLSGMGYSPFTSSHLPTSAKRFPDGAQYRVEIPSVEGPEAMAAVIDEATKRGVLVHRISQGSGGMLLTRSELEQYRQLGSENNVEVSLFTRPTASWGTGAGHLAPTGYASASQARGLEQVGYSLSSIERMAQAGIKSVLVTDLGVLKTTHLLREAGVLPGDLQMKVSVQMGLSNPISISLVEEHGANTYNVPSDLTLAQLAEIRAAIDIPIDMYIESPDDLGGFMRHFEIAEIVRIAAPVYVKFGLRNSPFIYPSGMHHQQSSTIMARERVRRAEIGLEILHENYPEATTSELGASGLAIPTSPSPVKD